MVLLYFLQFNGFIPSSHFVMQILLMRLKPFLFIIYVKGGGGGGSAYKELSDLHHKVRILRLLFGSYSCNALSETTLKLRMSHLKLYCKLGIRKSSPSYSFWI